VNQEVPAWRILGLIGRSGSDLVRILLGEELVDEHGSHVKKLHTRYFLDSAPLIRPLPGARELLEKLADLGWRSVLATSAGEEELNVLRTALELTPIRPRPSFSATPCGISRRAARGERTSRGVQPTRSRVTT
jgi:phosphoglycolate phosphatase-like HAD superfamily hydrolase